MNSPISANLAELNSDGFFLLNMANHFNEQVNEAGDHLDRVKALTDSIGYE